MLTNFDLSLIQLASLLFITKPIDSVLTGPYICSKSNCLNGVCWPDSYTSFEIKACYCNNGYTGYQCQINYDDCLLNKCQNGGTCIDKIADVECLCPPGYTGKFCQTEINECSLSPCQFGGTCIDEINGYRCLCKPGFSGVNCEVDVSVCNETQLVASNQTKCYNGGECIEGSGLEYHCRCLPGYSGDRCEILINQCDPNPCSNGSQCINMKSDFRCLCPNGRTGKKCESLLVPCKINSCQHGAVCLSTSNEPSTNRCYCVPGFYGVHCERHFNECMPINMCANDGLCIEGTDNYSCSCLTGFHGKHCEIDCRATNLTQVLDPRCLLSVLTSTEPSTPNLIESSTMKYTDWPVSSPAFIESSSSFADQTPTPTSSLSQLLATPSISPGYSADYEFPISSTFSPTPSSIFIGSIITTSNYNLSSRDSTDYNNIELSDLNTDHFFSPKFNGKSSYMILTANQDRYVSSLTINFQFKTLQSSGTLLSTRPVNNNQQYFIIIFLDKYRLKVMFACDSREMDLMEFPGLIEIESFHNLKFQLLLDNSSCSARLSVNQSLFISDKQKNIETSGWPCFRDYYFGSPDPSLEAFKYIETGHFQGCLKELNIDGVGLIKKAVDIVECKLFGICDDNPCNSRGECLTKESTSSEATSSWSCSCHKGYNGRRCQLASCSPNPCENNGLCLMVNQNSFNCLCGNGTFGEYCQLDYNSSLPAYGYGEQGANSYMIYGLPNQTHHFEMRLRFMANDLQQNNSLILFLGNSNNIRLKGKPTDFASLSLLDDMVVYQINLGLGTKVMVGKMNATKVHSVYIGQHRQLAWLGVDGKKRDLEIVSTRYNRLHVEPFLYVGNHKATPLRTFTTFQGCVFDIEVRNDPGLPFQSMNNVLWSSNVLECLDVHRCKKN